MSDRVLAQVEVERLLADEQDRLEELTQDYAVKRADLAAARVRWNITKGAEYLRAAGPVKEREMKALLAGEEHYTEYEIADAFCDASQEAMRSSRDRLSSLQTLLRSIKDQT